MIEIKLSVLKLTTEKTSEVLGKISEMLSSEEFKGVSVRLVVDDIVQAEGKIFQAESETEVIGT